LNAGFEIRQRSSAPELWSLHLSEGVVTAEKASHEHKLLIRETQSHITPPPMKVGYCLSK
ncbi:hypothetical protein J6590_093986, partial [Homalodisca vitripennis]